MAEFSPAVAVILKHEGGWVDDPNDLGGETNFGLSMLIIRRENLSPKDLGIDKDIWTSGALKSLTEENARAAYKRLFWDRYGYEKIESQDVATKVFDCCVNMGPVWGHRLSQYACVECGHPVPTDGIMGSLTIAALNKCDSQQWLKSMCEQMATRYRLLVAGRPSNAKFLNNWLHRAAWTHP